MATGLTLILATAAMAACGGGGASDSGATAAETGGGAAASTVATTVVDNTSTTTADTSVTTASVVTSNTADVAPSAAAAITTGGSTSTTPSTTPSNSRTDTGTGTGTGITSTADTAVGIVVASGGTTTTSTAAAPAASSGLVTSTSSNESSSAVRTTTATVSRPAGNTGTGFFVVGKKLYDAHGKEFRIRGVNHNHWDNGSPGLPASKANTVRLVLDFTLTTKYNWNIVNTQMLANKIVPIPGNWIGTCKSDAASLKTIVDAWVAQAPTWTQLNSNGMINIANEWGPPNNVFWRDQYIAAIARMRAAGYTGTLVVDSGGCGQDPYDVLKYGADVLAADPQKNILFDVHVYGGFSYPAVLSWQIDYTKSMAALKASGLPIVLGEFGPGRNIGPSPTLITPTQVINTAEDAGFGWMAWAWDDNDLANCRSDNGWFSMTTNCGIYKTTADLTTFGKAVVPIMQATAVPATIF